MKAATTWNVMFIRGLESMEYPDNRAKFKHQNPASYATKHTEAKRGAAPREAFRKEEAIEPLVEQIVAPAPPWNAVPDPSEFEI